MGASPSAGAVSFTCSATATGFVWSIVQANGVDTSGTNGSGAIVQNATNGEPVTSSAVTATLASAITGNNAVICGVGVNDDLPDDLTAGSGYTELSTAATSPTPPAMLGTEYKVPGTTTPSWSWLVAVQSQAIALEIAEATAQATSLPPQRRTTPSRYTQLRR
jgi:hypothetical protein